MFLIRGANEPRGLAPRGTIDGDASEECFCRPPVIYSVPRNPRKSRAPAEKCLPGTMGFNSVPAEAINAELKPRNVGFFSRYSERCKCGTKGNFRKFSTTDKKVVAWRLDCRSVRVCCLKIKLHRNFSIVNLKGPSNYVHCREILLQRMVSKGKAQNSLLYRDIPFCNVLLTKLLLYLSNRTFGEFGDCKKD